MSGDDERARERAAILQRRAKLVAYAVAAGVATAACSGRTSSVCLSLPFHGGSGGTPVTSGGGGVCLSIGQGGTSGSGPIAPCLSPIAGTSFGGSTICLQPPLEGGAPNPGAAGAGGEPATEGGAASDGGAPGAGGVTGEAGAPGPVICLTPVP